jgi:hypothetical protein
MSSLEALRAAIEQVRHVTPAKRLAFFSRLAPIKVGDINSLTLDEALAFLRSLNIVTASTLSVTTARQMVRQHLGSLVKGLYQAEESSIQVFISLLPSRTVCVFKHSLNISNSELKSYKDTFSQPKSISCP